MSTTDREVNLDQVNVASLLESEEAARRLGVKLATLYAYVSRGLLQSYPAPRHGRSLFSLEEVEALATRARGGKQVETRVATITTSVTQLRPDGPYYRGQPAIELARRSTFEATAELLWQGTPGEWLPLSLRPPARVRDGDLLRFVVVMAGATDARRDDRHPELVAGRLRSLISTMASPRRLDSAPPEPTSHKAPTARRLAASLGLPIERARLRALDAAMVLLADHELATSTLAVRVAASTRADLYDAVLAGLGALGGPLHGAAGLQACRLLYRSEVEPTAQVIAEVLEARRTLPGFGHPVYEAGDPRGPMLLAMVERLPAGRRRGIVRRYLEGAAARGQPPPNVDFALAALAYSCALDPQAVPTIFTVARVAGWGAHYLEELAERPLRYRARAVYATSDAPAAVGRAQRGASRGTMMARRPRGGSGRG